MAATGVYINIVRIPDACRVDENAKYSNIAATTAVFNLDCGKYCVDVIGSTFGTVTLQRLGPDGSTYLAALTAFSANGTANVDFPPGQYKVALA
jgi:hypothetical protein